MGQKPSISIGCVVIYRTSIGDYDMPAIVTATKDTLKGVELGYVPDLSSGDHVHLIVFSPVLGTQHGSANVLAVRGENVSGCYQEWNIPRWEAGRAGEQRASSKPWPGSWRWTVTD